jgi:hypothetical protein
MKHTKMKTAARTAKAKTISTTEGGTSPLTLMNDFGVGVFGGILFL